MDESNLVFIELKRSVDSLSAKMDTIISIISELSNVITKYDNSYNEEILKTQEVE